MFVLLSETLAHVFGLGEHVSMSSDKKPHAGKPAIVLSMATVALAVFTVFIVNKRNRTPAPTESPTTAPAVLPATETPGGV